MFFPVDFPTFPNVLRYNFSFVYCTVYRNLHIARVILWTYELIDKLFFTHPDLCVKFKSHEIEYEFGKMLLSNFFLEKIYP